MDRNQLRSAQKPLKDRYREDPTAAVITMHAEASLDLTDVSCSVRTGRAVVKAGLHPATGGSGTLACSGDMLLQALVACAGVTLRSVATIRGLVVGGTVRAEGVLDFRGTLGIDPETPVGFRSVHLTFDLDTTASPDELDKLIATTERYCVVLQSLTRGVPVKVDRF